MRRNLISAHQEGTGGRERGQCGRVSLLRTHPRQEGFVQKSFCILTRWLLLGASNEYRAGALWRCASPCAAACTHGHVSNMALTVLRHCTEDTSLTSSETYSVEAE
jgi:hypothetical protein